MTNRANSFLLGVEQCWEDYQNLFLIKTGQRRARDLLDGSADCVSASFGTTQREAYRRRDGFWDSVSRWEDGYNAGNQARAIIEEAIEAPSRKEPCTFMIGSSFCGRILPARDHVLLGPLGTFLFLVLPHEEGEIPMVGAESRQAFINMAAFIMEHGSRNFAAKRKK